MHGRRITKALIELNRIYSCPDRTEKGQVQLQSIITKGVMHFQCKLKRCRYKKKNGFYNTFLRFGNSVGQ